MDISVVLATYNRAGILGDTLRSFLVQELPAGTEFEILVVDNNSKDNTRDVVLSLAQQYPPGRLQYLFEPVQGKSSALNSALRHTRGEFIVFTDDDVLADRNWLSSLRECFVRTGCDSVGGKVLPLYPERTPQWVRDNAAVLNGPIFIYDFGDESRPYGPPMCEFFGANFAVKRSVLDQMGPFCEDLGPSKEVGGEDTEFIKRMCSRGKALYYCGQAVVHHHVVPEVMTLRYIAKWNMQFGRFWYRYKLKGVYDKKCICLGGVACYVIKDILKDAGCLVFNLMNRKGFLKRWVRLFRSVGIAIEMRGMREPRP